MGRLNDAMKKQNESGGRLKKLYESHGIDIDPNTASKSEPIKLTNWNGITTRSLTDEESKQLHNEMLPQLEQRMAELQKETGYYEKYKGDSDFTKGVKSIGATITASVPMAADAIVAGVKDIAHDQENTEIRNTEEYKALAQEYRRLQGLKSTLNPKSKDYKDRVAELEKQMAENEQARAAMMKRTAIEMDSTGMELMREANWLQKEAVEGAAETFGKPGEVLASTALSIGQNAALLAPAAVAAVVPGLQGAAPVLASAALPAMGVVAGAQKAYETTEAGGYASDALARGIISGGIEAATEKMGIDNLIDLIKKGGKSAVGNMLKQAGAEATEETISYVMNFAADKAAKDPNATWSWAELAESAISGGLSGLFFGGVGTGVNTGMNAARQKAADTLTGEALRKANESLDLVAYGKTFAEGSQTRKLADAYEAKILASDNNIAAITDGQYGRLMRYMTQELETSGPKDAQLRADTVQALHLDEKVMSPSAAAFMKAGDNATVADTKSAVMDRILEGDTTLTDNEIKTLDLDAKSTREALASLTGLEITAEMDTAQVLTQVRTAVQMAADVKVKQASMAQNTEAQMLATAQAQAQQAEEKMAQQAATQQASAQPTAQPNSQPTAQPSAPEAESVVVTGGQSVSKSEFYARHEAQGIPRAEIDRNWMSALETNGFGMEYPMPQTEGVRHSASKKAKKAKSERVQPRTEAAADTATTDTPAQTPAQNASESPANKRELNTAQSLAEKVANDAIKGSNIKAVRVLHNGDSYGPDNKPIQFGEDENGFYDKETGTVVINADRSTTAKAVLITLGHELVHEGKYGDSKLINDVLSFAEESMFTPAQVQADLDEQRKTYIEFLVEQKGYSREKAEATVDLDYAREELAADYMGLILGNTDALYRLAGKSPDVVRKARAAVERMLVRLTGNTSTETKAMRNEAQMLADRLDRSLRAVEGETTEAENKESAPSTEGEDAKRHSLGAMPGFQGISEQRLRKITQTPEFKAWFHDGNGELLDPKTGLPMVFYHGTGSAGYTRFEQRPNSEPGFWFAKHMETADSDYYTGRALGAKATKEFHPQTPKSWKKMVDYIESDYPHLFLELDDFTNQYVLSNWETAEVLASYAPTRAGLAKLNGDLQEVSDISEFGTRGMYNPGVYQVFLSMENPFVVDCGGEAWNTIDPRVLKGTALDGKVRLSEGAFVTTNDIVRAAKDAGYDGVIMKNVSDGRMAETTETVRPDIPDEVMDILASHNGFGAPSLDAALDVFADLGFYPGLTAEETEILSDYVSNMMESGLMATYGVAAPDDDFVVFDSAQIKSVHNVGTFDAGNPDIRYSAGKVASNVPSWNRQVSLFQNGYFDKMFKGANGQRSVLYVDKEKVQTTPFGAAYSLPQRTRDLDSKAIIREKDPTVKPGKRRYSAGKKKGNAVKTGGNTGNVNPDTGYERGSLADSFMRVLNTGDRQGALNMLETAAQQLAQAEAERAEGRKNETVANTFRPKLNEDAIARNRRTIEELIAKYGKMEQTSAAQQEVRLPKQIDDQTKVRSFIQTLEAAQATTEDVRNTLDAEILAGTAGTTYTPITDNAAMREVRKTLKNKYEFEKARREWTALVESGQLPTKQDIAKAEALYVQACAEGQVFEAQKLAAEIAIMGTQAGQVVQAMSLVKRMTPAGQLYYIQKTVDRLNAEKAQKDRNIKLKIDPKLAKQLLDAKNKAEIDAALDAITQSLADQMPVTIYDKWNTWRYLAMLGNPRTHVRNLFGNAIFTPARLIKDVAAMGLEHMVIEDKSQRTKGFADKDLRDFAKQDAELMENELRGGGKYDTKEMIRDKRRIFKADALHRLEKFNSGLLEAEDWIFLSRAYSNALSGFLAARGFTAEQVSGPNSTKEGRAALDAGRVYAINEAKKATYRDASKLAQWINHTARNSGPVGSIIVGGLMPFTKTPVNIVKRGIEYSPAGIAKAIVDGTTKLKKGEITAAEVIDELAAGLTGTALVGLGYALARAGLLVGGLGDDDEDKFEELQGYQEYSIRVGDKSYTIDWMSPTVLPVFVGEAIHRLSEQEGLDGWEMLEASMGLLDPVMSLSMLDGLNNTLNAVKYDDGEPIPAILQTIFGSYISQGVPSVLGAFARTVDDTRRTSFTPSGQTAVQRWANRLWQNSFVGKVPFVSEGRMAYIDEWGRTDTESNALMRVIENFVSPGYINPLKESPLEDELSRLAKATGDNGVYPNKAQKYFSVDKEKYVMNQDEYQEHLLYRGQKSYKLVSDITSSQTYNSLDDKTKAKAIELAYDYAADMAKVHTNEAYAPDKWMLKLTEYEAKGGDAAEYLMLRAKSKLADVSMTDMVLANPEMPVNDAAEILVMERTVPESFTDPYTKGYEYVMDAGQQKEYEELFHDLYLPAYAELVVSPEYLEATVAERKKLLSSLGTDIGDQTKTEMSDRLFERGIEPTEKQ